MVRILAIGDPHGNVSKLRTFNYRNVDAIILTGDLGKSDIMREVAFGKRKATATNHYRGYMESYRSTVAVLKYLIRRAPVYTIFGNVESSRAETNALAKALDKRLPFLQDALKELGVHVFNHRSVNIAGVRIGGLPYFTDSDWYRTFRPGRKASARALRETAHAQATLERFGKVDLLVCHQPPLGYLDRVHGGHLPKGWSGKHAGSKVTVQYVKKYEPKNVVCGHIHEGHGKARIGKTTVYNLSESRAQLLVYD